MGGAYSLREVKAVDGQEKKRRREKCAGRIRIGRPERLKGRIMDVKKKSLSRKTKESRGKRRKGTWKGNS